MHLHFGLVVKQQASQFDTLTLVYTVAPVCAYGECSPRLELV